MTTTKAQSILTGTPKRQADAVRSARKDIAAVESREELTPAAKSAAVAARRTELREEMAAIEESAKEAAAAVQGAGPIRPAVDPAEAMRIWQRQERELGGGADPAEIAGRLVEEGDRVGLQVLAEELPAFMRAAGEGDRLAGALAEIRSAETPLLSEEEASYRQNAAAADTALERIHMNSHFIRTDGETADFLVGVGDEHIDLTKED